MARKETSQGRGSSDDRLQDATKALAEAAAILGTSLGKKITADTEASVSRGLMTAAKALADASTRLTGRSGKVSTRDQLISAAVRLFSEKGFNGTSLEDIAVAAGFTKGAVYSQFASKEQLFLEAARAGLASVTPADVRADVVGGGELGVEVAEENGVVEGAGEIDGETVTTAFALALETILFGIRVTSWRAEAAEIVRGYITYLPALDDSEAPADESLVAFSVGAVAPLLDQLCLDPTPGEK